MARDGFDAAAIADMLAQRVEDLARDLLPNGRRDGAEWRCGSLAGERGQSLAVRIHGERRGVWCDFASGQRGDALDLVAASRFGGDKREALRWARGWLGLGAGSVAPAIMPAAPAPKDRRPDAEAEARRRAALALFLAAQPSIAGTPVDHYLRGRGIALAELGRQPRALRFHPAVWCGEAGRDLPAMLAAITDGGGVHLSTHRTWLARDAAGHWRKASLETAKRALGGFAGGFIPLQRGASAKPMREAPEGETVAAAEGIETALSVALACPDLRVIAAVSVSNFARIILPPRVRTLILCADNDEGAQARDAVTRAVAQHQAEGRIVRIARSPVGSDFNDLLNAEPQA
ncbi:DUF7146 domain-containing protein [Falsiroseomonas frigidaquae]|nr:toprim domain-containing protein [Falsiroseomonas frigidaquae]